MKGMSLELKVGVFAGIAILIIVLATVRVSDRGVFRGGSTTVTVVIDSAEGLLKKTPVEVAGIQVGYIDDLELVEGKAVARLKIDRKVKLGVDAVAQVRTKGFLGETYVDLTPGHPEKGQIREGGEIAATNPYVDLGQIASDIREVTGSLKKIITEQEGTIKRILDNMDVTTDNFSQFAQDARELMAARKEDLSETMERLRNITRKVDEGRGSLGRLLNDEETAENINEAARGLSETLGGINRYQFEIGYHLEYLAETTDFKSYIGLVLKPRPDKFFLLEFVVDPNPSPVETTTDTTITAGGATTTITTDERVVEKDRFLISAQLAKTFYNLTLRGGLIESRGGIGIDYGFGPVGLQFSAFDFRTDGNQRPHLKALASLNVTKNFFLVSGVDDFISKQQDPDWFIGGGFRLIDNDIKSILGAASLR